MVYIMKKTYLHGLMLFCMIFALLFSSAACQQENNPVQASHSLLDDLIIKDGFTFEHFDWFMLKSDFYIQSNLKEENSKQYSDGQTLAGNSEKTFNTPKMTVLPVYYFSYDKLVSGAYVARFTDEKTFLSCCKDLKSILDKNLETPFSITTDILNETPSSSGSGETVAWEGKDGSRLTVDTFNNTKTQLENPYYIIVITAHAPGPIHSFDPNRTNSPEVSSGNQRLHTCT